MPMRNLKRNLVGIIYLRLIIAKGRLFATLQERKYHRMGGTAILERFDGDKIVERIESPAMWEQMCFKPDRIKNK